MRSNRDTDPRQQGNRSSNDTESYLSMYSKMSDHQTAQIAPRKKLFFVDILLHSRMSHKLKARLGCCCQDIPPSRAFGIIMFRFFRFA